MAVRLCGRLSKAPCETESHRHNCISINNCLGVITSYIFKRNCLRTFLPSKFPLKICLHCSYLGLMHNCGTMISNVTHVIMFVGSFLLPVASTEHWVAPAPLLIIAYYADYAYPNVFLSFCVSYVDTA